jgi:YtcA family
MPYQERRIPINAGVHPSRVERACRGVRLLLDGARMTCRRSGPAVAAVVLATGCDPMINVYGSFFPAWAFCLLVGVVVAGVLRVVFAATGLEEGFVPVLLVYPALVLLVTCVTWLVLFRW